MRTILATLLAVLVLAAGRADAQLDRSIVPGPGPAPATAFPDYDVITTANGMRVIVVQNHELPTVALRLLVDAPPILEKDMAGVVDMTGQLMRSGTTKRSKDQLDEEVDRIGATLGASGLSVDASGLSRNIDKLVELVADITLRPSFPQTELQKLIMQTQSGLKARKSDPDAIVSILRSRILYGDKHPYGEVETEQSVGRITRAACQKVYKTWFMPNAVVLAVVGAFVAHFTGLGLGVENAFDLAGNDAVAIDDAHFGFLRFAVIGDGFPQAYRGHLCHHRYGGQGERGNDH